MTNTPVFHPQQMRPTNPATPAVAEQLREDVRDSCPASLKYQMSDGFRSLSRSYSTGNGACIVVSEDEAAEGVSQ